MKNWLPVILGKPLVLSIVSGSGGTGNLGGQSGATETATLGKHHHAGESNPYFTGYSVAF